MEKLILYNPSGQIGFVITVYNAYILYRNIQGVYELAQWCVTGIKLLYKLKELFYDKPTPLHKDYVIVNNMNSSVGLEE